MITFETVENRESPPVFGDVGINQLFINNNGCLCQKVDELSYNAIASPNKMPFAAHVGKVPFILKITKILPTTTKINF